MLNFNQYSLLEANLYYSENFKKRVSTIASPISDFLFSLEDGVFNDIKGTSLDITDKSDIISFIPLDSAGNEKEIKYRQTSKIGRFIRDLIKHRGGRFTDKQIEDFVNKFKASNDEYGFRFEIWEGGKVLEAYDENNYYSDSGTLGNSCMNGMDNNILDLYTDNTSIRIAVLLKRNDESDEDEIWGRALIWSVVDTESGEKFTFMDRIYTSRDSDVEKFRNWAVKNSIAYKLNNKSTSNDFNISYKDKTRSSYHLRVELNYDIAGYTNYPYLDSFCYGSGKYLYTDSTELESEGHNYITLRETDGTYEQTEGYTDIHGNRIPENDAFYSNYYNGYVDISQDDITEIDYANSPLRHVHDWIENIEENDDFVSCKIDNKWYMKKDCVWSDFHNQWILRYNANYVKTDYVHERFLRDFYDAHPEWKNPFGPKLQLEKAISKTQRRLLGWVYACEKGYTDNCPANVMKVGKSFLKKNKRKGIKNLKEFAKTKEKHLPEKIKSKK